jgi:hypothetical protein
MANIDSQTALLRQEYKTDKPAIVPLHPTGSNYIKWRNDMLAHIQFYGLVFFLTAEYNVEWKGPRPDSINSDEKNMTDDDIWTLSNQEARLLVAAEKDFQQTPKQETNDTNDLFQINKPPLP